MRRVCSSVTLRQLYTALHLKSTMVTLQVFVTALLPAASVAENLKLKDEPTAPAFLIVTPPPVRTDPLHLLPL